MPILAVRTAVGDGGGVVVEPPPTDSVPGTGVITDPGTGVGLPENPGGTTTHTLTAADGQQWDLGDYSHAFMTVGRRGYDAPSYQVYVAESPGFDGEAFMGARATARDMIVPLYLRADTREEFLIRKRNLIAALSPRRGLATIEVGEGDGTRRRIKVYFTGRGAEGDSNRDQAGRTWVRYNLELRAPEPYWRGDPRTFEFRSASTGGFFPVLPLRVSSGTSLGISDISIPGDVESFPLWTVYGPTNGGIVLRTTPVNGPARSILLSSSLAAGQWVQINTTPTELTVLDHAGVSRWSDIQSGSGMWPVPPGPITVEVTAAGATSATRVVMAIEPRYETA